MNATSKKSIIKMPFTSSFNPKELSCGGSACRKCGACRDWYLDQNGDDIVKRHDATCSCDYMFRHTLVPHPGHMDHEYYPLRNLICMCRDNY